jgi:hypothetical protein
MDSYPIATLLFQPSFHINTLDPIPTFLFEVLEGEFDMIALPTKVFSSPLAVASLPIATLPDHHCTRAACQIATEPSQPACAVQPIATA